MTFSARAEGLSRLDYLGHLAASLFLAGFLLFCYRQGWGGMFLLSQGFPSGEFLPISLLMFFVLFIALWIFIGATRRRMAHARLPEWIFWVLFVASSCLPLVSTLLDPRMPWLATFLRAYSMIALAFMGLLIALISIVRDFAITPVRAELARATMPERRISGQPASDRIDPSIDIHPALRDYFRKDRRKE